VNEQLVGLFSLTSVSAWHATLAPNCSAHLLGYTVLVWRFLLGSASGYLCELCRPVSGLPGRRALRSSVNYWPAIGASC